MTYKEKIARLVEAIKEKKGEYEQDDLRSVEQTINGFADYIKTVVNMESAIQAARFYLEGQDYREYVTNLDRGRRVQHDCCIANLNVLNRYCVMHSIDPIAEIEKLDRTEIADQVIKVIVDEYFNGRAK